MVTKKVEAISPDDADALVAQNPATGWDIPMEVDAASGGFVVPLSAPGSENRLFVHNERPVCRYIPTRSLGVGGEESR